MTDNYSSWWQSMGLHTLAQIVALINESHVNRSPVTRCRYLFDALNNIWGEYYRYRAENGQLTATESDSHNNGGGGSDNQAFGQLLLRGLKRDEKVSLCQSDEVEKLVKLKPHIMSQRVLSSANYDPRNIPSALAWQAQHTHRQLESLFGSNIGDTSADQDPDPFLKKLAALLYIVRSNNAHGGKTPRGPDLAKVRRDEDVCRVVVPVIEKIVDFIFDAPSRRLAVYGTLAPTEPNESMLQGLEGTWVTGEVLGSLHTRDNLPAFQWAIDAEDSKVTVKVIKSAELPGRVSALDSFEGDRYRRILVPVVVGNTTIISNIYAAND